MTRTRHPLEPAIRARAAGLERSKRPSMTPGPKRAPKRPASRR